MYVFLVGMGCRCVGEGGGMCVWFVMGFMIRWRGWHEGGGGMDMYVCTYMHRFSTASERLEGPCWEVMDLDVV